MRSSEFLCVQRECLVFVCDRRMRAFVDFLPSGLFCQSKCVCKYFIGRDRDRAVFWYHCMEASGKRMVCGAGASAYGVRHSDDSFVSCGHPQNAALCIVQLGTYIGRGSRIYGDGGAFDMQISSNFPGHHLVCHCADLLCDHRRGAFNCYSAQQIEGRGTKKDAYLNDFGICIED